MSPGPEIIVFAGTNTQAESYIMMNGLDRRTVLIARDAKCLSGLHDIPIVYHGTWYLRPDCEEVELQLNCIRASGRKR